MISDYLACYQNTVIQSLYMCPEFKKQLLQIYCQKEDVREAPLIAATSKTFLFLQEVNHKVELFPLEFRKALRKEYNDNFQ